MTRRWPSWIFIALLATTVLGGMLATTGSAALVTTGIVLLVLGGWAVSLCLHEFGHAYVAYRGGDRSMAWKGYLTLDIRRYTDPVLSIVLPLLFLAIGGLALPGGAVWIDHSSLRSRLTESMVSLAGPLSNLGLAIGIIAATGATELPTGLRIGLAYLAFVQVIAFLLNILPVPGLDGFGVIEPYTSYEVRRFAAKIRPWAPLALFAVFIGVRPVATAFFDVAFATFALLGGDVFDASDGYDRFTFWL